MYETNHVVLPDDVENLTEKPLPRTWGSIMLEEQNGILFGGSPLGVLAKSRVEVMPVKPNQDT